MTHDQTWKRSKNLPKQDCSFPDFTQKCANMSILKLQKKKKKKKRNLSANTMLPGLGKVTQAG